MFVVVTLNKEDRGGWPPRPVEVRVGDAKAVAAVMKNPRAVTVVIDADATTLDGAPYSMLAMQRLLDDALSAIVRTLPEARG